MRQKGHSPSTNHPSMVHLRNAHQHFIRKDAKAFTWKSVAEEEFSVSQCNIWKYRNTRKIQEGPCVTQIRKVHRGNCPSPWQQCFFTDQICFTYFWLRRIRWLFLSDLYYTCSSLRVCLTKVTIDTDDRYRCDYMYHISICRVNPVLSDDSQRT